MMKRLFVVQIRLLRGGAFELFYVGK